jgi:hypothetical protein
MHKPLLFVRLGGGILFSGNSYKALVINVNAKGIKRCDANIDPEVVLAPIDQMRAPDVLGHNGIALLADTRIFADHANPTSTGRISRFYDPEPVLVLFSVKHESLIVLWHDIGLWAEVVLLSMYPLHARHVTPQVSFMPQRPTPREVSSLLLLPKALKKLRVDTPTPVEVVVPPLSL